MFCHRLLLTLGLLREVHIDLSNVIAASNRSFVDLRCYNPIPTRLGHDLVTTMNVFHFGRQTPDKCKWI